MPLDLLSLQDAGEALSPPRRALLLAEHAPGAPPEARESVGRTHARLLRLHGELSGAPLEGPVICPSCAAAVELSADCDALLPSAPAPDVGARPPPLLTEQGTVSWRPVSYDDLA